MRNPSTRSRPVSKCGKRQGKAVLIIPGAIPGRLRCNQDPPNVPLGGSSYKTE